MDVEVGATSSGADPGASLSHLPQSSGSHPPFVTGSSMVVLLSSPCLFPRLRPQPLPDNGALPRLRIQITEPTCGILWITGLRDCGLSAKKVRLMEGIPWPSSVSLHLSFAGFWQ
ncbi:hypothetical protein GE21DRAFT_1289193 [Neurospora crassa]|nr:hypothetical protein GE21DRAFT_1289193 [Neurospora crassa]